MYRNTSAPTVPGQNSRVVTLAVVADLIAVVSVPVAAFGWKSWSSIAIVAGLVGMLASLLYLLSPRTRGSLTKLAVTLLLIAGAVAATWGVLAARDDDLRQGNGQDGGATPHSGPPSTSTAIDTTTSTTSSEETGNQNPSTGRETSTQEKEDPPQPSLEFTGPVFSQAFSLSTSTSYDLDRRTTAFPSQGADIGLDSTSLYAPATGELTLSERTDSNPQGCVTDSPYTNRIPVADIPPHQSICVATDQGQFAIVAVTATYANEVTMTYQLWQVTQQ